MQFTFQLENNTHNRIFFALRGAVSLKTDFDPVNFSFLKVNK